MTTLDQNGSKNANKHDYAYKTLKDMIITNKLPAESSLVERQICEMLDLSRTPVRSALQELVNENLAAYYPGRGTVVARIQIEDFIEIFEIRGALDVLAMRLFLRGRNNTAIKQMRKTVEDMKVFLEKEDYKSFVACDSLFHEIYFMNTGNKRLEKILATITDQIKRILNLTAEDKERCKTSYADHKSIVESIESGDEQEVLLRVKKHIDDSLEYHIKKATRR